MNFSKSDIAKNISIKSSVSAGESKIILESFLSLIKSSSKNGPVKLSNFGTFSFKKTPKRFGRNPKNKVSYIIPEHIKLNFKPSNKLKSRMN